MSKTCRACRQPIHAKPIREDRSCNGVKVIKYRFKNGSTFVDASCQCFGYTGRIHSSESCPLLRRQRKEPSRP